MFEDEPGEGEGEGAGIIERNDDKVTVSRVGVKGRLELELRTGQHMETLLWLRGWGGGAAGVMVLIIIVIVE